MEAIKEFFTDSEWDLIYDLVSTTGRVKAALVVTVTAGERAHAWAPSPWSEWKVSNNAEFTESDEELEDYDFIVNKIYNLFKNDEVTP
jgi:hypothetical protein